MRKYINKPILRISAVALAILMLLTCAVTLSPISADFTLGVSVLGFSQGEDEIAPGITWNDIDGILRLSDKYDPMLVLWAYQNRVEYATYFEYAANLLARYPVEQEADAFMDMLLYFHDYVGLEEQRLATPGGILQAANSLSAQVGNNGPGGENGIEQLGSFAKLVEAKEEFRHYNVEIKFQPLVAESTYNNPMDIVLLVDASESMAGEKLESAKVALKAFARQALRNSTNIRVGLVVYHAGSEIASELAGPEGYNELLQRIDQLQAYGNTGMQAGIVDAKRVLGIADGDTVSPAGRRKVILHFSDGDTTRSLTDNWAYGFNTSASDYAQNDHKRWSYAIGTSGISWKAGAPHISTDAWEESPSAMVMSKRLAALESQYAVSQGIEMYAFDYSPDGSDKYLWLSTYKMTNPPQSFAYAEAEPWLARAVNPAESTSYTTAGCENRLFNAASLSDLTRAFETIFYRLNSDSGLPQYTITDQLDERFELVGRPQVITGDGYSGDVEVSGNTIIWTSSGDDAETVRKLVYTVRVADKALFEQGAGASDGEDDERVLPSTETLLQFETEEAAFTYAPFFSDAVSVLPLMDGEAYARNFSGSLVGEYSEGDVIYLEGAAFGGSGTYAYQWLQGEMALTGILEVTGSETEEGKIVLPQELVAHLPEGVSGFTLKLMDTGAEAAGYKAENVAYRLLPVRVTVLYGEVSVALTAPQGMFDVRIVVDNGYDQLNWYYMGPGTKTYRVPVGSTVTAEAYAPPGYRAAGNGSTVKLVLPASGSTVLGQSISLLIVEQETSYFHTRAEAVQNIPLDLE